MLLHQIHQRAFSYSEYIFIFFLDAFILPFVIWLFQFFAGSQRALLIGH